MPPLPIPLPDPLPLPLPPLGLKLLLLLTFTLHLMTVNLAVGGSLLAAFHALRGNPEDRMLVGRLAPQLPTAVTFAVTFGVAPLLFLQLSYGPFFYSASVLTAVPWLALIFLLMTGYALLYRFVGATATRPWTGIAGALLLLAIGLALVNVTTLSLRPDLWAAHAAASPRGWRMNFADATLWPRFLHMAASILGMAGIFLAGWGAWREDASARRIGLRWFLGATASQLVWGPWFLLRQPTPVLKVLMDGTSAASLSLWVSVACGALALFMALPASQEGAPAKAVWPPLALALLSSVGMIIARDQAREAALAGFGFQPSALPHHTDWASLGVFGFTAVGLIALLVLILRWASQPAPSSPFHRSAP